MSSIHYFFVSLISVLNAETTKICEASTCHQPIVNIIIIFADLALKHAW